MGEKCETGQETQQGGALELIGVCDGRAWGCVGQIMGWVQVQEDRQDHELAVSDFFKL